MGQYAGEGEEDAPKRKKRKMAVKTVKPTLASHFKATDTSNVKKVGKICYCLDIYHINSVRKKKLDALVLRTV